jgi:hypothetical protein
VASVLEPKQPVWLRVSLVVALASLGLYVAWAWGAPWRPGRFGGLLFGTAAAVIFYIDGLYPLRRRLMSWPFGTAQRWLQFHIYGGVLALLFVEMHVGFRLPTGQFGWWLLVASVWSVATGVAGVLLQKSLPVALSNASSVEAIKERIPELIAHVQAEADRAIVGSAEALERLYVSELRPVLASPQPDWGYLVDWSGRSARRLAPLANVQPFLTESEKDRVVTLKSLMDEKLQLDAHLTYQRALRLWLVFHVPGAMLLLGLLTVHLIAVWYL